MTNTEPPPTYTQEDDSTLLERSTPALEPQIFIVPTTGPLGFQKGYLGADGERAAIEGELQVKGFADGRWGRVTMSLRTVETAPDLEIELGSEEVVLFSALSSQESAGPSPSVYPFSIPLPPDTPQCLHTPRSAILHTLTATLHPVDATAPKVSTSVEVHTRRYMPHPSTPHVAPETRSIDEPTKIEVEIPRTTFTSGEVIPLYVTVPTPRRELVVDQGLRLRNLRAELIRVVSVKPPETDTQVAGEPSQRVEEPGEASASVSASDKTKGLSSSHSLDLRSVIGVPGGGEVISLSGASCRLHPTRPLKIRLVLHQPHEEFPIVHDNIPEHPLPNELGHPESNTSCASISQETVLHNVEFIVCVHATFIHMHNRTERISSVSIPIMINPPTAPLPEVEQSVDAAYHKKHDRPPARTIRQDDENVPHYSEGEAGPSYLNGAPPPFEEREAPPPFFPEASTSRLPTFQESETEIYLPVADDAPVVSSTHNPPGFEGEGVLFGFSPSDRFDGYQEQDRSGTPPPSMEMSARDPDVTSLATMDENATLNALELAYEQHHDVVHSDVPPPPPPAVDDPSDPPPSIDSDFRLPGTTTMAASPQLRASPGMQQVDQLPPVPTDPHAPPPYGSGVPGHADDHDHDQVARPPPYVDLVPANIHNT